MDIYVATFMTEDGEEWSLTSDAKSINDMREQTLAAFGNEIIEIISIELDEDEYL